jgi:hypothetical protein
MWVQISYATQDIAYQKTALVINHSGEGFGGVK